MTVKVIDNFLTPTYADVIEMQLHSHQFPWFFNPDITDGDIKKSKKNLNQYGFSSIIFVRSEGGWIDSPVSILLRPFLFQIQDTIGASSLLRSRIDMTVCNSSRILHTPHTDLLEKNITTIYYVNDSDGYTVVYNEKEESEKYTVMKKISPKKNRLVIFDGSYYHTGHSPMENKNRILINSNFI